MTTARFELDRDVFMDSGFRRNDGAGAAAALSSTVSLR
jgi:hypothetical protein